MKAIYLILALIGLPIGMYITHSILMAIHADRLLFFLFWANVPVVILLTIITKLAEKGDD
jgi:hypothetical protein